MNNDNIININNNNDNNNNNNIDNNNSSRRKLLTIPTISPTAAPTIFDDIPKVSTSTISLTAQPYGVAIWEKNNWFERW
jgi:hypothetical protein